MENKLLAVKENIRISSVELTDLINQFRQIEQEEKYTVLKHKTFIEKIRKEVKTLKKLGLSNEQNFLPVKYKDKKREK